MKNLISYLKDKPTDEIELRLVKMQMIKSYALMQSNIHLAAEARDKEKTIQKQNNNIQQWRVSELWDENVDMFMHHESYPTALLKIKNATSLSQLFEKNKTGKNNKPITVFGVHYNLKDN